MNNPSTNAWASSYVPVDLTSPEACYRQAKLTLFQVDCRALPRPSIVVQVETQKCYKRVLNALDSFYSHVTLRKCLQNQGELHSVYISLIQNVQRFFLWKKADEDAKQTFRQCLATLYSAATLHFQPADSCALFQLSDVAAMGPVGQPPISLPDTHRTLARERSMHLVLDQTQNRSWTPAELQRILQVLNQLG